jgi:hypothetical protein
MTNDNKKGGGEVRSKVGQESCKDKYTNVRLNVRIRAARDLLYFLQLFQRFASSYFYRSRTVRH